MRGLLISATDTGVGKTILCAALLAAMRAAGIEVRAHKPVLTGLEQPGPGDHELLAAAAGRPAEEIAPLRYAPAVSPHLAVELAGDEQITPARLLAGIRAAAGAGPTTNIVEGVGGLLTPLADGYTVRDFAAELGLPLLLAARPGLGTINHTLLTLEAARAAGLDVRAVVLTPWPVRPGRIERSNRTTIASMGGVPVSALTRARAHEARELARVGSGLPWRAWLAADAGRRRAAA